MQFPRSFYIVHLFGNIQTILLLETSRHSSQNVVFKTDWIALTTKYERESQYCNIIMCLGVILIIQMWLSHFGLIASCRGYLKTDNIGPGKRLKTERNTDTDRP